LPADGRAPRGFTLTELLAVLAIVLVVVAGSIGVWLALAGAVAPGQATAVVQAMLVGAREYAVSNGVMTRVVFENSLANVENGTTMYFEYDADRNPAEPEWQRIPRRRSEYAGSQVFVLTGAPDLSSVPVPAVAADAENPNASDVAAWQTYRDTVSRQLAEYAFGDNNVNTEGYLKADAAFTTGQTGQDKFYMTFDATGTLAVDVSPANPSLLTIIQVPGAGRRVGEYQFYLLNANTGTQLVFE
jgi:prepilin-type N-terminal cleavage/methylation domain-containing protein